MIASLHGTLLRQGEGWVILEVSGVGYKVYCSGKTLAALTGTVRLLTEQVVREDRVLLYGFANQEEQDCFTLLTTVQGVGGRVALAILSVLEPAALYAAIAHQDKASLQQADGVGARLASRLITELKEKIPAYAGVAGLAPVASAPANQDALLALQALGYDLATAQKALTGITTTDTADAVRQALKALSPPAA